MAEDKTLTTMEVTGGLSAYRPEAYEFLREGLDYTVRREHGDRASAVRKILSWLDAQQSTVNDLPTLLSRGKLPSFLVEFIEEVGSVEEAAEQMNLHVGGEELCYGLRDLALSRWGLMAPAVLAHWGIRSTRDFGRMVFALVEQGLLAKQPDDDIRDFDDVFDFEDVFDRSFRVDLNREPEGDDAADVDDDE